MSERHALQCVAIPLEGQGSHLIKDRTDAPLPPTNIAARIWIGDVWFDHDALTSCPISAFHLSSNVPYPPFSATHGPNLLSLSRVRYFGACPYGVASRRCCATQGSVGDRVTPTWITFRDFRGVLKNAKSGRKKRSVTCMKSQAQICAA